MSSRKVVLVTAALTCLVCAAATGLTLSSATNSLWLKFLIFFLLSVTHEGVRLGRKTYLIDMASGNKRTEYVAVSNTVFGLLLLVIGLAGALLVQVSLTAVLGVFSLSALLAVILGWRLPEVQQEGWQSAEITNAASHNKMPPA